MTSSIHTNVGAMQALQQLQQTNRNLLDTQNRISTGLKVANAKDAAATWAIATTMKSDVASFKAISENLSLSQSTVSTARGSAENITNLVKEIKTRVTSAQNGAVDKDKIQADIDQFISQIKGIVSGSQFNGVNMLNETGTESVLGSIDRSGGTVTGNFISVDKQDLRVTEGGGLAGLSELSVTDRGDALLGSATAADDREGTRVVTFANGAAFGVANTTFTVNYLNAAGEAKNVTVTKTAAGTANTDVVTAMNADTNFSALFYAEVGAANEVKIMAKDRATDSATTLVSLAGSGVVAPITTAASATSTTMTFEDAPMKMGETIELNYALGATSKTIKLQVSDQANGSSLGTDADGNSILAINSAEVSAYNATGTQIADAVRAALEAHADFANGAAAAGVSLGLSAPGNSTLTITADVADELVSFKPPVTDYDTVLTKVEAALSAAVDAAAAFGSAQKRIEIQQDFVKNLTDSLNQGIGSLIDADMTEESARLQALQVQQQLGTQALSMANQAPQSILSLFRG